MTDVAFDEVVAGAELLDELWTLVLPPPLLTVSQWADERRIVSAGTSAFPGKWQTSRVPYLREPMDVFSDPTVSHVVCMLGIQLGKSELLLNLVGYFCDVDPTSVMIVQPTVAATERFSMKRLAPMISDCAGLRKKVCDPKSRIGGNTLRYKKFDAGDVMLVSSNSIADLTGSPIRVLAIDELDLAEPLSQGHPRDLAIGRTTTFWNRKILEVSSPLDAETSLIYAGYQGSTMGQWFVPCPLCGYYQILDFWRLSFRTLGHKCESCKEETPQYRWLASGQRGEWRHQHPERKTKGYHLSAMCSPWIPWEQLRDEFLEADRLVKEHDFSKFKFFKNARLAEPWSGFGEKLDFQDLYDRREEYEAEVPDGVLLLTCAVDVGENYMVWEVAGWGHNRERWAIETGRIEGSPYTDEVWEHLERDVLAREFARSDGSTLRISKMVVDSQYATRQVCQWTKAHQPAAIAIRGQGGRGLAAIHSTGHSSENARLVTLGSDALKDEMTARLGVKEPGPAYWHFPMKPGSHPDRGYDLAFFEEITNEKKVAEYKDGYRQVKWKKLPHQRNEAFDLACYSLAAIEILGGKRALENAYEAWQHQVHRSPTVAGSPSSPFGVVPNRNPREHERPRGWAPGARPSSEDESPFGVVRPKSGRGHF